MTSFWRIFSLECKGLWRSRSLPMLVLAAAAWVVGLPFVLKGDGTVGGFQELYVRYALGGVLVLAVIALVASATGSLSRERDARRLQMTLVRPVSRFSVVYARFLAIVFAGVMTLGVASSLVLLRIDPSRPCSHVLKPVLDSPSVEAERMYDVYMNDPSTSEEIRKTPKDVVLRILTQRAFDNYQTISTNDWAEWLFDASRLGSFDGALQVRLRFTNQFNVRQDVLGVFRFGACEAVVTNITQAVLTVPLRAASVTSSPVQLGRGVLRFENRGATPVMLRPRRDLDLLTPGGSFAANLLRAVLEMSAVLAVLVAFALFLGASLGRAPAAFVAFVSLLIMLMGPSVAEQYPDPLERDAIDRVGLWIVRNAERVTHPVSSLTPVEALSADERIEWNDALSSFFALAVFAPVVFALLAAFVLPRKQPA